VVTGTGVNSSSVTLCHNFVTVFLDHSTLWFTIVYMVLTSEQRQDLFIPYLEILRDCRIQSGVSQAKVAGAVNLSSKYVTLVEGGRRIPAVESLIAMMAASGVMRSTAEQMLQELVACFEWAE
jgi:DNA-binding XRE family transcriptional regulator